MVLIVFSSEVQLENLTTLLERIFFQTIESLSDSQWEIQRMANQVLQLTI